MSVDLTSMSVADLLDRFENDATDEGGGAFDIRIENSAAAQEIWRRGPKILDDLAACMPDHAGPAPSTAGQALVVLIRGLNIQTLQDTGTINQWIDVVCLKVVVAYEEVMADQPTAAQLVAQLRDHICQPIASEDRHLLGTQALDEVVGQLVELGRPALPAIADELERLIAEMGDQAGDDPRRDQRCGWVMIMESLAQNHGIAHDIETPTDFRAWLAFAREHAVAA